MSNENGLGYGEINSMEGCGIDDTGKLLREKRSRYHGPALELVSDSSEFFGDSKDSHIQENKMKGQIYDAFVKAGFGREANTLAETVRTEKGVKKRIGLGHYIALADHGDTSSRAYQERGKLLRDSKDKIKRFIFDLCTTEDPEKYERARVLQSKLDVLLN